MLNEIPDTPPVDPLLGELYTSGNNDAAPDAPPTDSTFTGNSVQVAGKIGWLSGLFKGRKAAKGAEAEVRAAEETARRVVESTSSSLPAAPKSAQVKPATPEQAQAVLDSPAPAQPVDPARNDWRNFTMKRLQTPDDIKALIDYVAQQNDGFRAARRGVVSNEQTTREAAAFDIEQLIGRQPAQAWNAAQIKAGHELLLETGQRIVDLKDAWKSGLATSDEDLLTFRRLLGQHAAIQEQLSGAAAEAGRALQIFNSVTGPAGKLRAQQVRDALEAMGGRDAVEGMMRAVDTLGSDPAKLAEVARKTAWRRTADAISEWTINAMLSSPATHQANITGNVLAMSLHPVERVMAAGIGKLLPGKGTVQAGEAAQMFGVVQGIKDGLRLAGKAFVGGPDDALAKVEMHRPAITAANFGLNEAGLMGRGVDLLGEWYVRLPGKALAAQDEFFKAIATRMELNARAYRQAVDEGLSGPALSKRTAELVNNPPDEMLADAQSFARYSTFTNSLWEGKGLLSKAGQAGQSIFADHPIAKLVVAPFIRTPVNIAKYIVERSPLEAVSPDFWHAMKQGGAARELALARMSLGTLVGTAMMSEMFTSDEAGNVTRRITGNGPDDPQARKALMATGWQPNSILMGDRYVSYNRADPFGAMLGMYANALDIMEYAGNDETADEVAAAVTLGTADALMSKSYLASLSEFFDVITQRPDASLTGFIAGQAGKPVPAWLRTVAAVNDTDADGNPIVRDARVGGGLDQVLKAIRSRVPGLAEGLPPKRDIWGEPLVLGGKVSVLTPFRVSNAKDDQLVARLIELDATPPKLNKVITHKGKTLDLVELDDGAGFIWDRYQEAAGKYARQMLDQAGVAELDQQYDLNSLPPEALARAQDKIRDVYRHARQAATLVAVAQHQGVVAREAPLPALDTLPELAKQLNQAELEDQFKQKPIGSRRLPPHMPARTPGFGFGGN